MFASGSPQGLMRYVSSHWEEAWHQEYREMAKESGTRTSQPGNGCMRVLVKAGEWALPNAWGKMGLKCDCITANIVLPNFDKWLRIIIITNYSFNDL